MPLTPFADVQLSGFGGFSVTDDFRDRLFDLPAGVFKCVPLSSFAAVQFSGFEGFSVTEDLRVRLIDFPA